MAEGFEPYHVPQQSRRDKLRVVAHNHPSDHAADATAAFVSVTDPSSNLHQGFFPLHDPSLLSSSDLVSCSTTHGFQPHHNLSVKEGVNLMGFSCSSSSSFLDPQQSSLAANACRIQDINSNVNNNNNNNPFLYSAPDNQLQSLREFTQSYNTGDLVVFRPEPPFSSNAATNQGLSLSLSSHRAQPVGNLPLELNLQRYGESSSMYSASTSNDVPKSSVPFGPFTGYASILKGSRFLKPAQQLLEELCDFGEKNWKEKIAADSSLIDPNIETLSTNEIAEDPSGGVEQRRKKSMLLSLLKEVYRKYKQYYQQMQAAVTSFEYVSGLENASPYASLALKTMSKHFKSLKNAITDQLQSASKTQGHVCHRKDEASNLVNTDRYTFSQRFQEHQPVWRPQRGLPERAVTILRAWLFEHFLHPYPTDTDKIMLAKQTGLSRNQVSNWFINARVRLWKPMVEEIHSLEQRQAQKDTHREEQCEDRQNDNLTPGKALSSDNPSASESRIGSAPSRQVRDNLPELPAGNVEPLNLYYHNMSSHSQGSAGVSMPGGVSLTLGLHQNNGIGQSEPFPVNVAQRFGTNLGGNGDQGYSMGGGFEAQNQHFGRNVTGEHLLRDFVG